MSTMTSCQQCKPDGFTATASCLVGLLRVLIQVKHASTQALTSTSIERQYTIGLMMSIVFSALR